MNGRLAAITLTVAMIAGLTSGVGAQRYDPNPRGRTTASPGSYSTTQGSKVRRPQAYSAYYNAARQNGYMVTPFVAAPLDQSQPVVLGPVRPYSAEEYAQLVISALEAGGVAPVTEREPTESVVVPVSTEDGRAEYEIAEATVQDVLDRGSLLLANGEQVKLRGVRVPSERDANEFTRLYAREAMGVLRGLTQGKTVYLMFEDPLRNTDGTILATVYLRDGTNLNKYMLTMGYGGVEEGDYYDLADLSVLRAAEKAARSARTGIWSR